MTDFKRRITHAEQQECPQSYIMALTDTMNVINGKWKLPIITALLRGNNRFKDLQKSIETITPRMLSKELKELEMNQIVVRKVCEEPSVLITYELSPSGESLVELIDAMIDWGLTHRKNVL